MSKFREYVKSAKERAENPAIKLTSFRPAVAPRPAPTPGADGPAADECELGLKALPGDGTFDVLDKAKKLARERGHDGWDATDPTCVFAHKAVTVFLAAVDPDDGEPFFETIEEMLKSPIVGQGNIEQLFDEQEEWEDECRLLKRNMTPEQALELCGRIAEGDPYDASPLDELRRGTLWSFTRFICSGLWNSLTIRSSSGGTTETDGSETSEKQTSEPESKVSESEPASSDGEGDGEPS